MSVRRIFVGILASIGFMVVLLIVAGAVTGYFLWPKAEPMATKVILEIDFEKGLAEYAPTEPLAGLFGKKRLVVKEMVLALQKAAADSRVAGVVARVGSQSMNLATVQEMRSAILSFRSTNKPALVYSETFGELGPGNNAYYLATAFDEIYLQPSGDLGLTGLVYQTPFVKETLMKLGVIPELSRRGEYKTAVETFTETQFTEPHEASLRAVMQSNFEQIIEGISKSRGLSADKVRMLFNQGPFLSSEAAGVKLVDGLLYRDEVYDSIRKKTDQSAKPISIEDYWEQAGQDEPEGPVIAVIYGVGAIHRGKSESSRLYGTMSMGSDTVTQAFRAAARDDKVKAILFRVDSPGGSYVASDTICRQVLLTKQAGKPVVVSMGDVAASGGYFVAIGANKIVAQPSTLTGSIGVFAGKAVTRDFWSKLGVTWDEVHTSDHSTMWSSTREYTPDEWEILQKWLDSVYKDFTTKVSKSRGLSLGKVQEAAKGRVWTGAMAKSLGLVDELGGFPDALRIAKELADIPVTAEVRLETYPEEKSTLDFITEMLWGNGDEETSSEDTSLELLASTVKTLEVLHRAAATAGLLSTSEVLSTPEAGFMHGR